MNKGKYKRLCVVALPFLLITGIIASYFLYPYKNMVIICDALGHCLLTEYHSNLYDIYHEKHDNWIEVKDNRVFDKIVFIEAYIPTYIKTKPLIGGIKGSPLAPGYRGEDRNFHSPARPDLFFRSGPISDRVFEGIYCSSVEFDDRKHDYTSNCNTDYWEGKVKYTLFDEDSSNFDLLRDNIEKASNEAKTDFYVTRSAISISLVLVFFLLSILFLLLAMANRFVQGSQK